MTGAWFVLGLALGAAFGGSLLAVIFWTLADRGWFE